MGILEIIDDKKEQILALAVKHGAHLFIIGDAVTGLSDSFKEEHPDIPWSKIIGMRNVLIHNYFGIDLDVV